MTVEDWYTVFQFGSAVLLGLTFAVGAAAIWTGHQVNERQSARIKTAEVEIASAAERTTRLALDLARQQEATANARRALLQLQNRVRDRHISLEEGKQLSSFLKSAPKGTITVECIGGTLEPCVFATELVRAIKEGGWTVADFVTGSAIIGGIAPSGVIMQVRDAANLSEPFAALRAGLNAIGVPVVFRSNPGLGELVASILVAGFSGGSRRRGPSGSTSGSLS